MNAINHDRLAALTTQAISDLSAGYAGVMVSIGNRLGLYKAMAGAGPLTAAEVAGRSGCTERYVREWLNAQAAGGYVAYHRANATYELTPEQEQVFADDGSAVFVPHAWEVVASLWQDAPRAAEAIRTGDGIAWGDHDERLYCGCASFFRNSYKANLISEWLPSLDGVVERLTAGITVIDVGCGHGHSTVLMAEAFPNSRFFGVDAHAGSIAAAKALAEEAGLAGRVHFEVGDARSYPDRGYDLVCFFDCVHDMGFPVDAVAHAAETLAPGGTVMLIEPFAGDRVEDNFNPVGRLYYAASTTLCCAHAISERGTHVLGAQAGAREIAAVCEQAGLSKVRQTFATPFNMVIEARR